MIETMIIQETARSILRSGPGAGLPCVAVRYHDTLGMKLPLVEHEYRIGDAITVERDDRTGLVRRWRINGGPWTTYLVESSIPYLPGAPRRTWHEVLGG